MEEATLLPTLTRHHLGNVRGKYLPLVAQNPERHAIGVTLGRLMIWAFVNAIPRAAFAGLITQLTLAGVQLGDKYQDHNALSMFTGVVVNVFQRSRLSNTTPNLQFQNVFLLVCEGITL